MMHRNVQAVADTVSALNKNPGEENSGPLPVFPRENRKPLLVLTVRS